MNKAIEMGILQSDNRSSLFFVLCVDPLSRRLNGIHSKVLVQTDYGMHATNHLLFIDNLELRAANG